jgi:hypothetical protein
MQPSASRKYRPTPEPTALRVVALSGFVIAVTSLLFHGFSGTVDSTQADRRVQKALEGVENPSTQAMARSLARSIEVRDGLRDHLARRLPMSRWHGQADQGIEFLTSVLLIAGGVAILTRRSAAVPILLGYAGLSVAQKVFNAAYLGLFEVPISRSYLESLIRLYPGDAALIRGVLDPLTTGPLYQILFAAYPVFVAAMMLRPATRELLQPAATPPAEPALPADEPTHENAAVARAQASAWSSFDNPSF